MGMFIQTEAEQARPQPAKWVLVLRELPKQSEKDCLGSPPFTWRQMINTHKLSIFFVYLLILRVWGSDTPFTFEGKSYGPCAMMLLICHSFYGISWLFKDVHFPDYNWRKPLSITGFISGLIIPFGLYYSPMFCLVSQKCPLGAFGVGNENVIVGTGLVFFLLGMFLMHGSDTQKFYTLKHQRPRSLITDGFFKQCRNPNYLGEVVLYSAYAIWSCHYLVILLFAPVWIFVFLPNMLAKDASMSRYPQFKAWTSQAGLFFPWIPGMLYDIIVHGFNRHGLDEVEEKAEEKGVEEKQVQQV